MQSSVPGEVLDFWFGALDATGRADEAHTGRWFSHDPAFDDEVTRRFLELHDEIAAGRHQDWCESARGNLAAVIVLDQFSRNMFRGTAKMFAYDDRAFALARAGVERGDDRVLVHDERAFLYMPFMHSEDLEAQERSVELFAAWAAELSGELKARVENALRYAQMHRDIVERFGRFPHRNAALGRPTTSEEREFLKQPGSSF
jgi:uncharacterized protein (DUF924 family)